MHFFLKQQPNTAVSFGHVTDPKLSLKKRAAIPSKTVECCFISRLGIIFHDIRKLNSNYCRSLRIAAKDDKRKLKWCQLDEIGHVRPTTWAQYSAASLVIKTFTRRSPWWPCDDLMKSRFRERWKIRRLKFFNKSDSYIWRQTLMSRADDN